jgi:hypothetical protein
VPRPSLQGVRDKLDWADKHLNSLNAEFQAFLDTDPYGIQIEENRETGCYLARMEVFREPPVGFSLIVGDFAHNARSALDHLVCRLVEAHGNKSGRWNAFPIYVSERDWIRRVEFRPKDEGLGPLEGIPKVGDAWAFIKRAQPYQRPKQDFAHPLRALNWYSNLDKHRLIPARYVRPNLEQTLSILHWAPEAELLETRVLIKRGGTLKDGTKLACLRFAPSGPDPQMYVEGPLPMRIAFGDEPSEADVGNAQLEDLTDFGREMVRLAEPFFL